MKKMFLMMLLLVSVSANAQKDVTKFLGIPVDGSKTEMKKKLIEKGFTYNALRDNFEGEFNGRNVYIYIATNNNKVWRIMVCDANTCGEGDIKIRFNTLCNQFARNKNYIAVNWDGYTLSESEDISYEMLVHKKRYEAAYYQSSDPEETYDLFSKKSVWFMISETYGQYSIIMFYDNEYNHADGEDL